MFRISISLAVLLLASASILAGCDLLTDDDPPSLYEDGVITYTRSEYPQISLIGLDLASREEAVLADTLGWDAAWAPDGERIAFTAHLSMSPIGEPGMQEDTGPEVFEMDLRTKEWRIVTPLIDRPWGPGSSGSYYNPVWSPDGSRIAYTRCGGHGGPCDVRIAVWDGATGYTEEIVIPRDGSDISLLDWSPDGGSVLLESDPDGLSPYYNNVYQVELSTLGRELVLVSDSTFVIRYARYSPRGDRIAFIAYANEKTEIYISGVDGSSIRPLTDNSLTERSIAWSPDGKAVSFSASGTGEDERQSHIYIMEARQGAPAERVTTTAASYYHHEWRPESGGGKRR